MAQFTEYSFFIDRVAKETAKAIAISCYVEQLNIIEAPEEQTVWLPKSQVKLEQTKAGLRVTIPAWLSKNSGLYDGSKLQPYATQAFTAQEGREAAKQAMIAGGMQPDLAEELMQQTSKAEEMVVDGPKAATPASKASQQAPKAPKQNSNDIAAMFIAQAKAKNYQQVYLSARQTAWLERQLREDNRNRATSGAMNKQIRDDMGFVVMGWELKYLPQGSRFTAELIVWEVDEEGIYGQCINIIRAQSALPGDEQNTALLREAQRRAKAIAGK